MSLHPAKAIKSLSIMFWTLSFLLSLYHLLIPPFYFSICPIPLDASNIKMLSISIPWHLKKNSGNCFTFSPINRQICSKKYHHFPSHPLPMHACMCSFMSDSLLPHRLEPAKLFCPWDFPSKNTGVGFYLLLQQTFPTPESKRNCISCVSFIADGFFTTEPLEMPPHSS